mmetsp:Transcript_26933/g.69108  ORF Transcript_26933/g.69108 Transcript_26933/m.69108 type:complete len:202 (-) Transcript_26933:59-664(-)
MPSGRRPHQLHRAAALQPRHPAHHGRHRGMHRQLAGAPGLHLGHCPLQRGSHSAGHHGLHGRHPRSHRRERRRQARQGQLGIGERRGQRHAGGGGSPADTQQFVGAATARSELWEAAGGRPGLARLCAGRQQQRWLRRGGSGAVLCHRPGGGAAGGRRPAAGPGAHAGASGQWLARAAARSQQSSWLSLPTAGTPGSSLYQ